jgi:shikimate 5-dehydrogenase
MLLYQGVAAWELWTSVHAPVDVMKAALEEAVQGI